MGARLPLMVPKLPVVGDVDFLSGEDFYMFKRNVPYHLFNDYCFDVVLRFIQGIVCVSIPAGVVCSGVDRDVFYLHDVVAVRIVCGDSEVRADLELFLLGQVPDVVRVGAYVFAGEQPSSGTWAEGGFDADKLVVRWRQAFDGDRFVGRWLLLGLVEAARLCHIVPFFAGRPCSAEGILSLMPPWGVWRVCGDGHVDGVGWGGERWDIGRGVNPAYQ